MASISTIYSSSPTLNYQKINQNAFPNSIRRRSDLPIYQTRPKLSPTRSVAREVPTAVSATNNHRLEKEPRALWTRYVDWLYQHKEIGLYLDVSRVGFTDEFVKEMEPRLQAALKAMVELEKGAIANPDEGRMVGHYWLRDSNRAPNSFLKNKIDTTLDAICKFADDIVSGKVSQWIMFMFNRKQAKLLLLV
jgi:glucose-6-phosphate isomerase